MSNDLNGAVTLATGIEEVNFERLGRWLSTCDSDEQAQFLFGLAEGFEAMPDSGIMQWQWVADGLMRRTSNDPFMRMRGRREGEVIKKSLTDLLIRLEV